jgi:hypothetical protein
MHPRNLTLQRWLSGLPKFGVFALSTLLFTHCIEPFNPAISSGETDILVIDGYINAGHAVTTIKLSRLTPITSSAQPLAEKDASVSIVSDGGNSFSLRETGLGLYTSDSIVLPVDEKYKLEIVLTDETTYETEFAAVKQSPPIDSLKFRVTDRIEIHAYAHDGSDQTRYYRWYFDENWEINSPFVSHYKIENDTIVPRPPHEKELMFRCWQSAQSRGFVLGTTEKFVKDEMDHVVNSIPLSGYKTDVKYAITVRQHPLSAEEYRFLKLMEKNSTQVGSFFDPLPSELRGNVTCTSDPSRMAVGWVGVYTTVQGRLFIRREDLPGYTIQYRCLESSALLVDKAAMAVLLQNYIPVGTSLDPEHNVIIIGREIPCMDCRVYGTSEKPEFW